MFSELSVSLTKQLSKETKNHNKIIYAKTTIIEINGSVRKIDQK